MVCRRLITFTLFLALNPLLVKAETVTLQTKDWCPFVCEDDKDRPGFVVELLKLILAKDGHNLELEIQKESDTSSTRKTSYLYGPLSKAEGVGLQFLPIEFASTKQCFYVLKEDPWEFYDFKNLSNRKIKYNKSNPQKLDFIVFEKYNTNLFSHYSSYKDLSKSLQEMIEKKFDTLYENPVVFNYYSEKEGLRDLFAEVGCIEGDKYFLGYRPKKKDPKSNEKIFLKRLQELKDGETIDKIVKKYYLKDWRP